MYYIGSSIIRNGIIVPLNEQDETGKDKEVYEMFRVENGKAIFLQDHLKRYANSLQSAGIALPDCFNKLPELIDWLIICNQLPNNEIRLCVATDGTFQGGFVESVYPTKAMYANGVHCTLMNAIRETPNAKIFHADMRMNAHEQQSAQNAYESILVNPQGCITEGSRSNIFFVKDNRLITAPDQMVLKGIMRQKVIEVAYQMHIDIEYKAIPTNSIAEYDAAFISSTPARILPIKSITNINLQRNNETIVMVTAQIEKLINQ